MIFPQSGVMNTTKTSKQTKKLRQGSGLRL